MMEYRRRMNYMEYRHIAFKQAVLMLEEYNDKLFDFRCESKKLDKEFKDFKNYLFNTMINKKSDFEDVVTKMFIELFDTYKEIIKNRCGICCKPLVPFRTHNDWKGRKNHKNCYVNSL